VTVPPDASADPPRYRPTSRLLVIDPRNRLLLLRVYEPRFNQPILWFTPGGGVDPGESFEQAAVRELWEETGIVAPLGPYVWTRRHVSQFLRDGPVLDLDERYFVVRVDDVAVTFANGTAWEQQAVTDHRWWSLEELAEMEERFAPSCLLDVLPPILTGEYPPEPIAIGL
jgi:8-oxo-dGTP diphosphatase